MSTRAEIITQIEGFESAFDARNNESEAIAAGYADTLTAAVNAGDSKALLTARVDAMEADWERRAAESQALAATFADSMRTLIADLVDTPPPPPPSAMGNTLWMSIDAYDELTDADFIRLRDDWGVTRLVAQFGYVSGYGGSQVFTTDTSATFDAKDGRTAAAWTQCRKVRYGNNGTGTAGLGNIVGRVHALGMEIYHGLRWRSLRTGDATPLAGDWFNDTKWAALADPVGPWAERIRYAKAWGFDGMAADDEILNTNPPQVPEPKWDWNYPGNTRPEAETRAKVFDRGAQFGAMMAALWPDVDWIQYSTTGHGGFPDDYDELVRQPGAGRVNWKERLVQRHFWDGIFSTSAWSGNLSLLNVFYRGPFSTAQAANDAMALNRDYQLTRMARPPTDPLGTEGWRSWNRADGRFRVNPFIWPGRAANLGGGEDRPLTLDQIQVAFDAGRAQAMDMVGLYCQTITQDRLYFTDPMEAAIRGS